MATAAVQGGPSGLFVVTVIVTVLPLSPLAGLYVKAKGLTLDEEGLTVPDPFSVIVTVVALPLNVLSETVTGSVPHVLPLVELRIMSEGFTHPHETAKIPVVVTHPWAFLTARK